MINLNKIYYILLLPIAVVSVCYLLSLKSKTFFVEHARTKEQIEWGLMQRHFLPENQGMLFHYQESQRLDFWSFNCYMDLSIGFIDEKRILREIKTLKAFPEKMDPTRPVFSYKDFHQYFVKDDPVVSFFQKKKIVASTPVQYALEMNVGWFEKNNIQVGDVLHWDEEGNKAFFIRAIGTKYFPKASCVQKRL